MAKKDKDQQAEPAKEPKTPKAPIEKKAPKEKKVKKQAEIPTTPPKAKPEKVKKQKLTRKEKKELLKQQLENEKKLIEQGAIPIRNRYKPHGFFWRVFSVCLAFFFGIFTVIGGFIGLGAVNTGAFLGLIGFDAEGLLSEAYLHMGMIDLYKSIVDDINNHRLLSLGAISKYTPYLDGYLTQVDEFLAPYGIELDWPTIKEKEFGELGAYAKETILSGIRIGPILGLNEDVSIEKVNSNAPLYALSYGKYLTDYEITDGAISMYEGHKATTIGTILPSLTGGEGGVMDFLGTLELGSLLGLDIVLDSEVENNNSMLYTICYGTEGVDYKIENNVVKMLGGKEAVTVNTLTTDMNGFMNGIELGSLLGLNTADSLENRASNAMMYALCYGSEDVDYKIEDGKIVHIEGGKAPTTIGDLTGNSNEVINTLPLGELLGLNSDVTEERLESNAIMYSLCYGTRGVDYEVDDGKIVRLTDGKEPTTIGKLTESSSELIQGMQVDALLGVTAGSDAIMRYVAYGPELSKDDEGNYLMNEDGTGYKTEEIIGENDEPTGELRYAGGGRYIIEEEDGEKKIVMLPDPNDENGALYLKKTVGDLTAEDANLLEGMTIGAIVEIDSSSSRIMQAMKDWTIEDLSNQKKIDEMHINDILDIKENEDGGKPDDVSSIMWTMRNWTLSDLNNQENIESLTIGEILNIEADEDGNKPESVSNISWVLRNKSLGELKDQSAIDGLHVSDILQIDESSSKLMQAMKSWKLGDLQQQTRIERLKIGQLLSIDGSSSKLMQAMADWRISDLSNQDKINTLTLGDVIDIDENSPAMLRAMQSMTLGEISTGVDTLTLEDVLGETAFESGNRILDALRYHQVKELGNAIDKLTVEDVFGDQMWSYTLSEGYDPNERVAEKIDAANVEPWYSVSETEVVAGWYKGNDESGWTKVADELVKNRSYVETKHDVTRNISYLVVDYDKNMDEWMAYSGDMDAVKEDENGFYYMETVEDEDEEGADATTEEVRRDLEPVYTYTEDGVEVEGKRIYTEDGEAFYYIEQEAVTRRYAAENGSETYAEDEVTLNFRTKDSGEDVTRYTAGAWYLLIGDGEAEGASTLITELGTQMSDIASDINEMTLRNMYVHELIGSNPSTEIPDIGDINQLDGRTITNLDELTIPEVITFVGHILQYISRTPSIG